MTPDPKTTPWSALLRVAALRFGLTPETFWRLSAREWRALTHDADAPALSRAAFETLRTRVEGKEPS